MSKSIYVLEEYMFYSGSNIRMISEDYNKVKKCFDEHQIVSGYGLCIRKYELDKKLGFLDYKSLDWIEIDYDGKTKTISN